MKTSIFREKKSLKFEASGYFCPDILVAWHRFVTGVTPLWRQLRTELGPMYTGDHRPAGGFIKAKETWEIMINPIGSTVLLYMVTFTYIYHVNYTPNVSIIPAYMDPSWVMINGNSSQIGPAMFFRVPGGAQCAKAWNMCRLPQSRALFGGLLHSKMPPPPSPEAVPWFVDSLVRSTTKLPSSGIFGAGGFSMIFRFSGISA